MDLCSIAYAVRPRHPVCSPGLALCQGFADLRTGRTVEFLRFSADCREKQRRVGVSIVVSLIMVGFAFAEEAPQEMDCSRVYLGDLTSDLRRAAAESERAAREALQARGEVKDAEAQASELEAQADEKEREALQAQAVLEAASPSETTRAEIAAFVAERDAEFATREAERARSRAASAARRSASAELRAEESKGHLEKLRAIRQQTDVCDEYGTYIVEGARADTAEEWNDLLTSGSGATLAGAIASCTEARPDLLEGTIAGILVTSLKGYPDDQTQGVGEGLFRAVAKARGVNIRYFDPLLLGRFEFEDMTREEIEQQIGEQLRRDPILQRDTEGVNDPRRVAEYWRGMAAATVADRGAEYWRAVVGRGVYRPFGGGARRFPRFAQAGCGAAPEFQEHAVDLRQDTSGRDSLSRTETRGLRPSGLEVRRPVPWVVPLHGRPDLGGVVSLAVHIAELPECRRARPCWGQGETEQMQGTCRAQLAHLRGVEGGRSTPSPVPGVCVHNG